MERHIWGNYVLTSHLTLTRGEKKKSSTVNFWGSVCVTACRIGNTCGLIDDLC